MPLPVAILAGGLATRLRPLTEKIPKVLLPVAGKPFLAHQLELLRGQGIRHAVLCLGYLGEMVTRQFGDGHDWGMHLEYSFDGPTLLGTGGALRQALPKLGEKFFVLYGDSYLTANFGLVAEAFDRSGQRGLMTVFRNEGLYDTSNVLFRDGRIVTYDKQARLPEMRHIDYGLSFSARRSLRNGRSQARSTWPKSCAASWPRASWPGSRCRNAFMRSVRRRAWPSWNDC